MQNCNSQPQILHGPSKVFILNSCRISVWIEGDSIDRETSVDCLADVLMKNSAELNHRVADVNSGMYYTCN